MPDPLPTEPEHADTDPKPASRPCDNRRIFHLAVYPDWLEAIRASCAPGQSAHAWAQEALLRCLRLRGHHGLTIPPSRKTRHHTSRPSKAEAKRRRQRAAEKRCRNRKRSGAIARERAAQVKIWITPDDTILASDLDGCLAGIIYSDGGIAQESRHPFERLLSALRDHYLTDQPLTDAQLAAIHRYHGWPDSTGRTSV